MLTVHHVSILQCSFSHSLSPTKWMSCRSDWVRSTQLHTFISSCANSRSKSIHIWFKVIFFFNILYHRDLIRGLTKECCVNTFVHFLNRKVGTLKISFHLRLYKFISKWSDESFNSGRTRWTNEVSLLLPPYFDLPLSRSNSYSLQASFQRLFAVRNCAFEAEKKSYRSFSYYVDFKPKWWWFRRFLFRIFHFSLASSLSFSLFCCLNYHYSRSECHYQVFYCHRTYSKLMFEERFQNSSQ